MDAKSSRGRPDPRNQLLPYFYAVCYLPLAGPVDLIDLTSLADKFRIVADHPILTDLALWILLLAGFLWMCERPPIRRRLRAHGRLLIHAPARAMRPHAAIFIAGVALLVIWVAAAFIGGIRFVDYSRIHGHFIERALMLIIGVLFSSGYVLLQLDHRRRDQLDRHKTPYPEPFRP